MISGIIKLSHHFISLQGLMVRSFTLSEKNVVDNEIVASHFHYTLLFGRCFIIISNIFYACFYFIKLPHIVFEN